MCIKGPPKPYLPGPRSCYPCRPHPRASTSPATAAALLPMGEPRPPRSPASRALRRLPPPPLLLLSGSAHRARRPTLLLRPRHRAANPPASTPLPLFLLRSARCSLSLVEGHRLARPRRRRDGPCVAVIWARRGLPRALQPLADSERRGALWSWLPPAKAGAEEVVLQPIREISGTVKLLSSKSISYRDEETLPLFVCLQVECVGDDGEEQDGLQMMKDLNLVFHDASNLFDLMLEW